jgi:CBS domain-containing protein
MTLRDLPDLIRHAPPLVADDTVAKAVRLLRVRGLPALPVAHGSQLMGAVHEEDLAALASDAANPEEITAAVDVEQLARPVELVVRDDQDAAAILRVMRERGASFAAVVAADGRYLGMVLRRDLLAALVGAHPTPPIAGLATPFGVHLTTGTLRAGASDLALAATGVALMTINLLSTGILVGLGKLAERLVPAFVLQGLVLRGHVGLVSILVVYVLQIAIFLLLLRMSPITRVHAAEHMVVHAIEEGEDLTMQKVRAMPRVHPRCGTNLMALLILLIISEQFLSSMNATMDDATRMLALFVLAMVILLTWRRLGAGLQRWVTTRRPNDYQLQRAIEVGEALLAQVSSRPGARTTMMRRIWNAGFVQVVAGFLALAALVEYGWPLMVAARTQLYR